MGAGRRSIHISLLDPDKDAASKLILETLEKCKTSGADHSPLFRLLLARSLSADSGLVERLAAIERHLAALTVAGGMRAADVAGEAPTLDAEAVARVEALFDF